MAYALKTKKNTASVKKYISAIKDEDRKKDVEEVCKIMEKISGSKPKMWGSSIIGFSEYHYKYPSGQEGDWMVTGLSSRAQNLTIYIMPGYQLDNMKGLLKKLGPHKTGRSCLYIKRLEDIHIPTLRKIIKDGITYMKKNYEVKK
jgi:hypothetical protein